MPPDRTPADPEPARRAENAEGAGSVVVGLDPSGPSGIAVLNVVVDVEPLREFGGSWERAVPIAYDPRYAPPIRDAMRWSLPAEGEETPPCPA